MDGPGDLMDFKSPTKKAKQSSEASTSSSGLKRGRVPLPYEEKSERGQFRDAAALGNGQNPNALYHAAYSNISRIDPNISYVMRKMKEESGFAVEIRKWYLKFKKNKGT